MSPADRFARLDAALDVLLDLPPEERADRASVLFADAPGLLASVHLLLRAAQDEGPLDAHHHLPELPEPTDPWLDGV